MFCSDSYPQSCIFISLIQSLKQSYLNKIILIRIYDKHRLGTLDTFGVIIMNVLSHRHSLSV